MRKYLYLTELLLLLSTQSTHKCVNTDAFIVVFFSVLTQGKAMKEIFLVGANELFGCLGLFLLMSLFLTAETAAQACMRRCLDVGNKEPGRDRDSLDTFSADENANECVTSRLCQLCAQWAFWGSSSAGLTGHSSQLCPHYIPCSCCGYFSASLFLHHLVLVWKFGFNSLITPVFCSWVLYLILHPREMMVQDGISWKSNAGLGAGRSLLSQELLTWIRAASSFTGKIAQTWQAQCAKQYLEPILLG